MGGARGRLTSSSKRRQAIELIVEAQNNGARLVSACKVMGISVRTYQRWVRQGLKTLDKRLVVKRTNPANKLSDEERRQILAKCNEERFANLNPAQIVPILADEGIYIASESTIYRILKDEKQNTRRTSSKKPNPRPISTHTATKPNQLWSWDITWLPGPVKGNYFKLYLIMDVFSRFIVGWEVHEEELTKHAKKLIKKARFKHGSIGEPLILHSDNGSIMKAQTFQALLAKLEITKSYSRPRVSNDNAFSESLFRTLKYTNTFPVEGFANIELARKWVMDFVELYNKEFLHSGIKFVTPYQRHYSLDFEILANRVAVYQAAKARNPERWSKGIRNWDRINEVTLNPISEHKLEREKEKMRQLS
ncbi:MAG: IS3 family transposase [Bacillota bacterium]